MIIYPISYTKIDWSILLKATSGILGRSITKSLDAKNMSYDNYSGYIAALGEFLQEDCKPNEILKDPGILLNYLNFGFLIITDIDTLFELQNETGLRIIHTETTIRIHCAGIVNGTLLQYREAIINGCSPLTTLNARMFLNKLLTFFENAGFAKAFQQYSKKDNKDGTFLLT